MLLATRENQGLLRIFDLCFVFVFFSKTVYFFAFRSRKNKFWFRLMAV